MANASFPASMFRRVPPITGLIAVVIGTVVFAGWRLLTVRVQTNSGGLGQGTVFTLELPGQIHGQAA